jgi:hypothetical protein
MIVAAIDTLKTGLSLFIFIGSNTMLLRQFGRGREAILTVFQLQSSL